MDEVSDMPVDFVEIPQYPPELKNSIIWGELFDKIMQRDADTIQYLQDHADILQPLLPIDCLPSCPCLPLLYKGFEGWKNFMVGTRQVGLDFEVGQVGRWLRAGACSCVGQVEGNAEEVHVVSLGLGPLVASMGPLELMERLAELCPAALTTVVPDTNYTPLFAAVTNDQFDIIEFLLTKLSADDVNRKSLTRQNSPLMEAVRLQNRSVIERLLSFPGIEVNTRNALQETPLIYAVRKDDRDTIQALIKAGADVNMKDKHGRNALSFAVRAGSYDVIQDLLAASIETNVVDDHGDTVVMLAVFREDVHILQMLLDAGANPNCISHDGFPALVAAAYDSDPTMVECLLNRGANLEQTNQQAYSAMHISAWNGHIRNVELLLKHGARHDERTQDGNTPLSLACHGRCSSVVKLLLERPCNVNNADKDGDTPMHYAAWNGDLVSMQLLLAKGADPHAVNRLNTTPLWNAVNTNQIKCAQMLIQHNADLTVKSVGIDQHAQSNTVVECYDVPRSLLWIAAVDSPGKELVALLLGAGYPVWSERWLQDEVQSQAITDEDMRTLLKAYANSPPRLLVASRGVIRKIMGPAIQGKVECLDIPDILKRYILLTDIVGPPSDNGPAANTNDGS